MQNSENSENTKPNLRRNHVLKVRLNIEELELLDAIRGQHARAQAIRFLLNNDKPQTTPEINSFAWTQLSKSASNLNQISKKLNGGENVGIEEIKTILETFRGTLLGAKL